MADHFKFDVWEGGHTISDHDEGYEFIFSVLEIYNKTDKYNFNAISIAPQCYEHSWFSIFEQLQEFVEFIINQKFIDKERVYVMGSSMGGYATWQLAMARPEWFAAIVPICGGGIYAFAERLLHMGVWAFHGSEDTVVYPKQVDECVKNVYYNV